jgi:hypothetical protein
VSAGVVAVASLLPCAASAQQSTAAAVAPGERVQDVELVGAVVYESNVAGSTAAVAALRRLQPSDEIFEPSVHFTLARPIGRETVYVVGDAGYDFYARNSVLNRENLDIHPGAIGKVGPCQTDLTGEYSRAQRELSELATSPTGLAVPFQDRNVLQVEEVGGDATCGRGVGFGPSVTASETWTQNSSKLERYVDAQTFSGSGGITYQRPVLGSLRVFGAFSDTRFPNRAGLAGIEGAGVATGYQTFSGGVTYTRAVGSRLQGSVSLSYTKLDQQGAASPGFSGPTYSASLFYQVSSRLTATASVSRATVPSIRLNSTFSIEDFYSGGLNYRLSSRLTAGGGASFVHEAFNGTATPVAFDLTDEKIYRIFGNVTLQLTRRVALGLDVQQLQRNANFPGLSYPDTRVGLTARATF